jgi:hypothetical protein
VLLALSLTEGVLPYLLVMSRPLEASDVVLAHGLVRVVLPLFGFRTDPAWCSSALPNPGEQKPGGDVVGLAARNATNAVTNQGRKMAARFGSALERCGDWFV